MELTLNICSSNQVFAGKICKTAMFSNVLEISEVCETVVICESFSLD